MTKKPRENRIPIMMSDDELNAIDDWRFAMRIGTRAEAVRRLCQVGLFLGSQVETITDNVSDLSDATSALENQAFEIWRHVASPVLPGDVLNREAVVKTLETLIENISEVGGGIEHLSQVLTALYVSIVGIANLDRDEAKKKTTEAMTELNETLEKLHDLRSKMKENRRAMSEVGYRPKRNDTGDEQ